MAINGKRFSASTSQLTTSATTIYTATNVRSQIHAAVFTNTTGGAITITVYLVPTGQSAAAANTVISARSLAAGETYKAIELVGQWLSASDTVQALASANTSISVMIGGIEQTG